MDIGRLLKYIPGMVIMAGFNYQLDITYSHLGRESQLLLIADIGLACGYAHRELS